MRIGYRLDVVLQIPLWAPTADRLWQARRMVKGIARECKELVVSDTLREGR